MLRIFIIATILGASTLTYSIQSFAAEKGEKRLNKKERQALKIRNEKLGHISYMCISALAISAANNQSISQTPQFKASQSFWDTNVRQATSHVKPKKVQGLKNCFINSANTALTEFGNGSIMAGGQKATPICSTIEAEGLDGPTAATMLKG